MSKDGGPAFPVTADVLTDFSISDGGNRRMTGMSLRDYFAAAAMQGLIAAGFASVPEGETGDDTNDYVAGRAYYIAEAMLVAREAE